MNEGYSLDHIIQECVDERSAGMAKDHSLISNRALYESSWDAMNSWIESRLRKNKV